MEELQIIDAIRYNDENEAQQCAYFGKIDGFIISFQINTSDAHEILKKTLFPIINKFQTKIYCSSFYTKHIFLI